MKLTFILLAFCFISLIAVQANSTPTVMDTYIKNFPLSVKKAWAQRDGRYKHYLWHQVREGWNRFSDTTKEAFRTIGWEPPNPARTYDSTGRSSIVLDNKSGEEFLYMHQMMINKTNEIIKKNRERMGNITGWTSFPAPGDPDWPVPDNYTITGDSATTSSTTNRKTDSFYRNNILPNEKLFKDYTQLRKMSLAELGARIEVTVHGYAHMRWSNVSELGYRNSYRGIIPNIDPKWDDIRYDWLGESYSAHVNPIFWKIHGWVNDRIEDWRKANNLRYIKWNGTWTGGPMGNVVLQTGVTNSQFSFRGTNALAGVTRGAATITVNAMDEALKILKASNAPEAKFTDNVYVPKWTRK